MNMYFIATNRVFRLIAGVVWFTALLPLSTFASSGGAQWGYEGREGPNNWGTLSSKYETCSEGRSQSPINVGGTTSADLGNIEFDYKSTPARIVNNGHTIQQNYNPGSGIRVQGEIYKLLQLHFHSASENTVKGESFPLEMHLVHKSDSGRIESNVVIGASESFY